MMNRTTLVEKLRKRGMIIPAARRDEGVDDGMDMMPPSSSGPGPGSPMIEN
jgi:hypothetical protein